MHFESTTSILKSVLLLNKDLHEISFENWEAAHKYLNIWVTQLLFFFVSFLMITFISSPADTLQDCAIRSFYNVQKRQYWHSRPILCFSNVYFEGLHFKFRGFIGSVHFWWQLTTFEDFTNSLQYKSRGFHKCTTLSIMAILPLVCSHTFAVFFFILMVLY